jgi:hypothetical protein
MTATGIAGLVATLLAELQQKVSWNSELPSLPTGLQLEKPILTSPWSASYSGRSDADCMAMVIGNPRVSWNGNDELRIETMLGFDRGVVLRMFGMRRRRADLVGAWMRLAEEWECPFGNRYRARREIGLRPPG